MIAGRIPGRTAEEIEHFWTSRVTVVNQQGKETDPFDIIKFEQKIPAANRKCLPQVKELRPDFKSLRTDEEQKGNGLADKSGQYRKQVVQPAVDCLENETQLTRHGKKRKVFTQQDRLSSSKAAKRTQKSESQGKGIVSRTVLNDIAQGSQVPADKLSTAKNRTNLCLWEMEERLAQLLEERKMANVDALKSELEMLRSENEILSKDKEKFLSDLEAEKKARAELEKTQADLKAAHKEELENMQIIINNAKEKGALADIEVKKEETAGVISS